MNTNLLNEYAWITFVREAPYGDGFTAVAVTKIYGVITEETETAIVLGTAGPDLKIPKDYCVIEAVDAAVNAAGDPSFYTGYVCGATSLGCNYVIMSTNLTNKPAVN